MLSQKFALLALIFLGIAVSGCCCCNSYVPGGISIPPTATPVSGSPDNAGGIIGTWSSEGPDGTLVDPATGGVTGSTYSGEWYVFRQDGTYRYVIVGSGMALSGGVVREGRYRLGGDSISLYGNTESWYPYVVKSGQTPAYRNKAVQDEEYSIATKETDTISIDGTTFYRVGST